MLYMILVLVWWDRASPSLFEEGEDKGQLNGRSTHYMNQLVLSLLECGLLGMYVQASLLGGVNIV